MYCSSLGFCEEREAGTSHQEHAYVSALGVRRPWRGRGLARYMLKWFFYTAYRNGKRAVTLYVNSESLTGALRLYERVGMHSVKCFDLYEKEIRPGRELATLSLEGNDQ